MTLRFGNCLAWLRHLNPHWSSRSKVAYHYDLTDKLFKTFLNPHSQYSCAYFHRPDDSFETAQETKLARLAAGTPRSRYRMRLGRAWHGDDGMP